jgi:hypothetical protein
VTTSGDVPPLVPVASSSIRAVGYDAATHRLYVRFHSGELYAYADVPRRVHRELMAAGSVGGYFNREVRPRYACAHVEHSPA